jgi:hypothetical protein
VALYLEIKADTNDADYITDRTEITKGDLERLTPLIEAISKTKRHNWVTSEYSDDEPPKSMYSQFPEDLIEEFQEYVLYGEHGVHTIKKIVLLEAVETILLPRQSLRA